MKALKVYYREQADGCVQMSAALNAQSGNVVTDDYNTIMQCFRLRFWNNLDIYMIWDIDNWDDKVWS